MESYEERVIAFLDILGFKEIVRDNGLDEIKSLFQVIFDSEDARSIFRLSDEKSDDEKENYNTVLEQIEIRVISDSVIISVPNNSIWSLAVIVDVCYYLQCQLLSFENPVYLRGAIDIGEIYFDERLVFGKGLISSYLAQEHYAIYPRIIFTEKVKEDQLLSFGEENSKVLKDEDSYFFIDYVRHYIAATSSDDLKTNNKYLKFKKSIADNLYHYSDPRVREKYLWLKKQLDIYEAVIRAKHEGVLTINY